MFEKSNAKRIVVEETVEFIKSLPPAPRGTAEKLVREDRMVINSSVFAITPF